MDGRSLEANARTDSPLRAAPPWAARWLGRSLVLAMLSSLAACTGQQVDRGASPGPGGVEPAPPGPGVTEPAPPPVEQTPGPGVAGPSPGDGSPGAASPGGPKQGAGAGAVDYSCKTAADCAVKNVGNCCGYFPGCVNKDSPTFPDQVMAECQAKGLASICGFPSNPSCACVQGRCEMSKGQ